LLKVSRFGDFRRSTLSWWRSVRISASSEALDRNSPITAHQISLSMSLMDNASSDSRLSASRIEFTVGTGVSVALKERQKARLPVGHDRNDGLSVAVQN
jgi:hypothetical protein